jgi:hypothetical protein
VFGTAHKNYRHSIEIAGSKAIEPEFLSDLKTHSYLFPPNLDDVAAGFHRNGICFVPEFSPIFNPVGATFDCVGVAVAMSYAVQSSRPVRHGHVRISRVRAKAVVSVVHLIDGAWPDSPEVQDIVGVTGCAESAPALVGSRLAS